MVGRLSSEAAAVLSRRDLFGLVCGMPAFLLAAQVRAQAPISVVVTFSILQDLVNEIVSPDIVVRTLVQSDADTHSYQMRPSDAQTVTKAQLLVSNGLGLETWLPRLLGATEFRGRHVVASDGIDPLHRAQWLSHAGAGTDPHAWQDVSCVRQYVANIAAGVVAVDPANATIHHLRAKAFDQRLAALDDWIKSQIETVPVAKRQVLTGHDAFGYFARAYGVRFVASQGMSTESEPTARDIAAIISMVRRLHIKALFIENLTNPTLIRQIAEDADAVVGPPLYSDALSSRGGPAATYEAMMRYNVNALVAGMSRN